MTTIKLKNGSGAPLAGDLVQGEPALDLTNKRLYTEDSGGTVIEVGTNPGEDVTFADNRKAIFGAGSDLQIYHDGSNSYVQDAGTGNLYLRASNAIIMQSADGAETIASFHDDNLCRLYFDNAVKLATTSTGIDVTGTVTTTGNVGIGTSSPDAVLTSVNSGALTLDSNDGNHSGFGLLIEPSTITANTVNSAIGFAKSDGRKYAAIGMQTYADVDQNGLNFYVQSTTSGSSAVLSEAMRIDSDGKVGIGTGLPNTELHLLKSGSDADVTIEGTGTGVDARINLYANSTGVSQIRFGDEGDTNPGLLTYDHSDDSMFIRTNNSEAMRIDSSGNVGIGHSSPSYKLDVRNSSSFLLFASTDATTGLSLIHI